MKPHLGNSVTFDFIIAGAGCSGLSLAWHLLQYPELASARIALIDPDPTPKNDKTWCFWIPESIPTPIPFKKSWNNLDVFFPNSSKTLTLENLSYHCISSEAYTQTLLDYLSKQANVNIIKAKIERIEENSISVEVKTDQGVFSGGYCFKSFGNPSLQKSTYPLLQHFGGWEIKTNTDVFDSSKATLMDFRVMKDGDAATFVYVLPYSDDSALVEYTVFSDQVYSKERYDEEIKRYITTFLKLDEFDVERTEYGVIPMTDRLHSPNSGNRIIHIGTASGIPKASTGYAFSRIQRQAAALAKRMSEGKNPNIPEGSTFKYRFFDVLLLDILYHQKEHILSVFEALFHNNPPERVLRFLDEQTSITEDLNIMASVPPTPFLKAIVKNLTTLGSL